MQPAMCLQCLDILNTKGLEAEAQSLAQMQTVDSGRRQFIQDVKRQLLTTDVRVQKLQHQCIYQSQEQQVIFTKGKCNFETKQHESTSFHSAK